MTSLAAHETEFNYRSSFVILLNSSHFLDHLIWLLEQSSWPSTVFTDAAQQVLEALLSTSAGVLFLASVPGSVARILRFHLTTPKEPNEKRRLGLEMAVKLEAISCIDRLIVTTRRKGEQNQSRA